MSGLRAIFAWQVAPLVASITPDPAEAPARAGLITTQLLGLALCRYVLRIPPASELTRAEILAWVSPAIQRYLTVKRPCSGRLATAEESPT